MDLAVNDSFSTRLELQECGGPESYLMLRTYAQNNLYCKHENSGGPKNFGVLFENITDCIFQICQNENDCKPLVQKDYIGKIFIRIAKPKKYCPNIIFIAPNEKDPDEFHYYINNNPLTTRFENEWSFLKPDVQMIEDDFLRKIEIRFNSVARSDADIAKLGFLENILKIMEKGY